MWKNIVIVFLVLFNTCLAVNDGDLKYPIIRAKANAELIEKEVWKLRAEESARIDICKADMLKRYAVAETYYKYIVARGGRRSREYERTLSYYKPDEQ